MFEIDFFRESKGSQQPHYLAVIGVTIALLTPLVFASGIAVRYVEYKTELPSLKYSIEDRNKQLEKMREYEVTLNTLGLERIGLINRMNDLADVLGHHAQWSEALASLTEGIPRDVAIVNIDLNRNPLKTPSGQELRYEYEINIGAIAIGNPAAMQRFIQFLRFSWPLKSSTRNVEILAQRLEQVEGMDLPLYMIQCKWEP